jgi:hypothetical protein
VDDVVAWVDEMQRCGGEVRSECDVMAYQTISKHPLRWESHNYYVHYTEYVEAIEFILVSYISIIIIERN